MRQVVAQAVNAADAAARGRSARAILHDPAGRRDGIVLVRGAGGGVAACDRRPRLCVGARLRAKLQVAEAVAAEARVLCVDEFQVADIVDAVLLSRLFSHLFARGAWPDLM